MSRLPQPFVQSIETQFGKETSNTLTKTISSNKPPVSIRINDLKWKEELNLPEVPWYSKGFYLKERPIFTMDPLFHAGVYYVQEASSMILGEVFRQVKPLDPVRVLDLCAAPGGKSTLLLSEMAGDDLLVSNEVIRSRASILHENISKWGASNCFVTNSDPSVFQSLRGFFDFMVVDAPCSGEGMFRKDPEAINEWSPDNVQLCSQRQQRILADVWDALAYDGILFYSTCTFNEKENEDVLRWLIDQYNVEPVVVHLTHFDGIITYEVNDFQGFKMLPGEVEGEGFSFFVLRKKGGYDRWEPEPERKKKKKKSRQHITTQKFQVPGVNLHSLAVLTHNERLYATPFPAEREKLKKHITMVKSGIFLGESKKNKMVPAQELALSSLIDIQFWPSLELDYQQALSYLMKEPFDLESPRRGYNLVKYRGIPLGWINHLGSRFNNSYPSNWRIVKDFRKESPFTISDNG